MHTVCWVPTQVSFLNSACLPSVFPVQLQIFPVPITVVCDCFRCKPDLTDIYSFLERNRKFHCKVCNIIWNYMIHNLGIHLSQCFPHVLTKCLDSLPFAVGILNVYILSPSGRVLSLEKGFSLYPRLPNIAGKKCTKNSAYNLYGFLIKMRYI